VLTTRGDFVGCVDSSHQDALQFSARFGAQQSVARTLNEIGNVLYGERKARAGTDYYQRSLKNLPGDRRQARPSPGPSAPGERLRSLGNLTASLQKQQEGLRPSGTLATGAAKPPPEQPWECCFSPNCNQYGRRQKPKYQTSSTRTQSTFYSDSRSELTRSSGDLLARYLTLRSLDRCSVEQIKDRALYRTRAQSRD